MNTLDHRQPVIVGISGDQPLLLHYAATEAVRRGTELVVLHAYGSVLQPNAGTRASRLTAAEDSAAATLVLDRAKVVIDELDDSPSARYVKERGLALEMLERHSADAQLLVVASDEISWFERVLGGAVARHLTEYSICPVVLVPPVLDLDTLFGGVSVAVHMSPLAIGPLRFAFEEASARGARLQVLHVVQEGATRHQLEDSRRGLAELIAGWREEFPDVAVTTRVISDDGVALAVSRVSEQSELMVVGRARKGILLGRSSTPRLARSSHCPLAVVDADYGAKGAATGSTRLARR